MANPLSIKCPHCTASFKVKDKSAFGKKVKCPKCETPFVIPKPVSIKSASTRKKSKPATLADDFFDEESDSSSDFFDDDFDDWEDDLDGGPTLKPKAKKNKAAPARQIKSGKSIFATLSDYGFSPFITVTFLFLLLMNLTLFFVSPRLLLLSFFLSMLVGIGCLFAGGLGLLIEAGRESGTELVLCLIVPFYNLYFGISRFESTKNAVAAFAIGVALITTSLLLAFAGIFGANSRKADFAQRAAEHEARIADVKKQMEAFPQNNNNPFTERINRPRNASPKSSRKDFSSPATPPSRNVQQDSATSKFDLSQVEPLLLTWPAAGVSGSEVYGERSTGSIGKVFEASNTFRSKPGDNPAGSSMNFRVYLPPNADPESPVPCILVPPAGSNLLSGMPIDSSDLIPNPEHEPYLKAGFAVVTFSLDGLLPNRENSNILELRSAYDDFQKSKAGLVNCLRALMETQAVIPGIDKNNIFIAGHSSAGTLSLLFAEHVPQIKGCLAYAASVDLEKNFKPHIGEIKQMIPGIEDFIKKSSPKTHVTSLKCPVFLFHSQQDPVTSFADTQRFVGQLKQQGTEVEFVVGNGADHYQPMIDEGIPKGIEWIKKIVQSNRSASDPQMVASQVNKSTPSTLQQLTLHKATFKVVGLDAFYTNSLKSNQAFWTSSLISKAESGLESLVTGYSKGTVRLDLNKMLFSFEYFGDLPSNFATKFADHIFTKSIIMEKQPLSVETIKYDPNSHFAAGNYLTFRVRNIDRIRFNLANSPKIIEARLRLIDRYVPDSLVVNLNDKWAYIKLKGIGDLDDVERAADKAFTDGGLFVNAEKINLTEADLKMADSGGVTPTNAGSPTTASSTPAATNAKQKFVIRYGVFGGNSLKIKESVKRSLKGFVWVDQSSIKFNPDTKEISFINRSAVDNGALERALTRNKFYQLDITQAPLPAETTEPEKTATEKEEAKAGTE